LLAIYINNVVLKPVLHIDKSSIEMVYDHGYDSWFYRLIVKNVGLRAATNCSATMNIKNVQRENIYELTAEEKTKRPGFTMLRPDHLSVSFMDLGDEGFSL